LIENSFSKIDKRIYILESEYSYIKMSGKIIPVVFFALMAFALPLATASAENSIQVVSTGTTNVTTTTTSSSGTLTTTFQNNGVSTYSSIQASTPTGFVVTNSFAAVGTGAYSANIAPTNYAFFPKNVPNPTWKMLSLGSATYKK
jgi:hypothetical protein